MPSLNYDRCVELYIYNNLWLFFRRNIHSTHQLFEVTNQITNFSVSSHQNQRPSRRAVYFSCNCQFQMLIATEFLLTWNRKIGDLKWAIWLVTSPKNWRVEWTSHLTQYYDNHFSIFMGHVYTNYRIRDATQSESTQNFLTWKVYQFGKNTLKINKTANLDS